VEEVDGSNGPSKRVAHAASIEEKPFGTAQRVPVTRCQTAGKHGCRVGWVPPGSHEPSAHESRHGMSGTHADGRDSHLRVWEPPRPSGNGRKATGRGDTDRLLTRGKLRRVVRRAEGDQVIGDKTDSFVGNQEAGARQTR
jgi:hypothetical protein